MDERDFKEFNKQEVLVNHDAKIVSFSYIYADNKDLYTYYFLCENGKIKLHSINVFRKNGKSGNTYKQEEIFHHIYKKTVTNYETGDFKEPKVPTEIWQNVSNWLTGYLFKNIIMKQNDKF